MSALQPPAPIGRHPLAGQWVRATRNTVEVDGYVVEVLEADAEVRLWAPTTGRVRGLHLEHWDLRVIQDPR